MAGFALRSDSIRETCDLNSGRWSHAPSAWST